MYPRTVEGAGYRPYRLLGTATPEEVARGAVRALDADAPEVIVNPGPVRLLSALCESSPDLGAWIGRRSGAADVLRGRAGINEARRTRVRPPAGSVGADEGRG